MEVTKIKMIGVAVVLAAAGLAINLSPRPRAIQRTEQWLGSVSPSTVGAYSTRNSYTMDKKVYETLKPFGIISRVLTDGRRNFDVVVIAGDDPAAFHDPRICFTSQGMELKNEKTVTLDTTSHGPVPLTVVEVKGQHGQQMIAAYCYRGPKRMHASPKRLSNDMFFTELTTGKPSEGVFYRFISMNPETTEKELLAFIKDYMKKAREQSQSYL